MRNHQTPAATFTLSLRHCATREAVHAVNELISDKEILYEGGTQCNKSREQRESRGGESKHQRKVRKIDDTQEKQKAV